MSSPTPSPQSIKENHFFRNKDIEQFSVNSVCGSQTRPYICNVIVSLKKWLTARSCLCVLTPRIWPTKCLRMARIWLVWWILRTKGLVNPPPAPAKCVLGTAHVGTATWGVVDCEPHSRIRILEAGTRMFIQQDDSDPQVHGSLETTALRPRRWLYWSDVGTRGCKSIKPFHVLGSCFQSRLIRMVAKILSGGS